MHKNAAMPCRTRPGFTLLELLIVMSIAAAVAMFALPSIDIASMRVNGSARQAGMTLLGAQRLAVLRQHNVVVALDSVNRRLRTHEDRNNDGLVTDGEMVNFTQLEEGVRFGRGSAPAVGTIGAAAITFVKKQDGMPAVTFTRGGSAGENGGFYITSTRGSASARYASDSRAFEVNRGTGRTVMHTYSSNGWRRSF